MNLIGNNIILVPNRSRAFGEIVVPEAYHETSLHRVLKKGPKVKKCIKGVVITSPHFSEKKFQILNEEDGTFICGANRVYAVVVRGRPYPVGRNRLLIERLNEEQSYGSIVIPAGIRATDQSLHGIVRAYGIDDDHQPPPSIPIGSRVRLLSWNEHMIDIEHQGRFYLSVRSEDIVCEW